VPDIGFLVSKACVVTSNNKAVCMYCLTIFVCQR